MAGKFRARGVAGMRVAVVLFLAGSALAEEPTPGIGDRLPRLPVPAPLKGSPPVSRKIFEGPGYLPRSAPVQVDVQAPPTTAYPPVAVETTAPPAPSTPTQVIRKETGPLFTETSPPFAGSDLFVGRSVKVPTRKTWVEIGVVGQAVPLELLLATHRGTAISQGEQAACVNSTDPNCLAQAATLVGRVVPVLTRLSDAQWSSVLAAAKDPGSMQALLQSVGVTAPSDITAVQNYLASIPGDQRTRALLLARRLADTGAAIRLEPFARVDLPRLQFRVGVPLSAAVRNAGNPVDLGNLNLDLGTGWTMSVRGASLGLSIGITTYLPTSTGGQPVSLIADLFQAPKYLYGYLTLAPSVVAGVDAKWVSLQVHADLWIQARVRTIPTASNLEVFQYGLGLGLLPHLPVSVIAQLEGVEGLNHASAFRSLFVVAGLQLSLSSVHLGIAGQVPLVDRARQDLGTYGGFAVGGLAKYSVLARTSVSF